MRARLNSARKVKIWFFRGKRQDRAGVLGRVFLDGFSVTVLPSPHAGLIPSDGEQWVVLFRDLLEFNPEKRTATALCMPIRRLRTTGDLVTNPKAGFEDKLRKHGTSRPSPARESSANRAVVA